MQTSQEQPSRLQTELAARILDHLKQRGYGVGHHLVELELCRTFSVSRTPVRGALKLLADRGVLEARPHRGFVVRQSPEAITLETDVAGPDEEELQLFQAIARDRMEGTLPDQCSQLELVRRYAVRVGLVIRVLRQMAELGLVERKPGNGWLFAPAIDSAAAQEESYQLRLVIEPAILLQPAFRLDRAWAQASRRRHEAFLKKSWRDTLAIEFFDVNADFHAGLATASGNRYMLHIIQQQNRLRSFLNYNWRFGADRVRQSVAEHLAILSALEADDRELAALLMRRHLESARTTD